MKASFTAKIAASLERQFVRIDVVVGAVDDVDVDVDDRIAADDAVEHRFFDALLAGRNVFLGNGAADDLVLDRDALAALVRLNLDDDVAVLTATARLLDQLAFAIGSRRDGFAISDLRLAGVGLDLELAEHAIANDLEVQLAHAGDDRLAGVLVGEDAESRILFRETLESDAHLFLVRLVFGSIDIEITGSGKEGGSSRIG